MERNKERNINFFKKVWYSITKFDKYPDMAAEEIGRAIKYLAIMVSIVTVFLIINSMIDMHKLIGNLATYVESNIPEFSYLNGEISMETTEPIIISEVQFNGIDRVVIDPFSETPEEKIKSQEENDIEGTTLFLLKDQIILKNKQEGKESTEQPYTYEDFIKSYTQEDIKEFNKAEFIEYITSEKMSNYYLRYGLSLTMYLILTNMLVALIDSLQLAILGWITAITARIKMKFTALFNMAIYSLTLPMILNMGYIILNCFTDFTISYFQVAYITIAYIYLAASIFILKDDFLKKKEEVEKIKKEQIKVREEIKRQEEKKQAPDKGKKEKKKEKEREEESGGNNEQEPKGSEA